MATQKQAQPCATSALRVTLGVWNGGGAAGSSYRPLDFTNVSAASCTLYGYPGVSFVTRAGGSEVGAAADRIEANKQLVVLSPGGQAHATLQVVDVLNFPRAVCPLTTAHWLRVYPPDQFTAAYVAYTAQVCSGPKPVFLFVGPVQPHA
jgi:hypothetical protein